MMRGRVLKVNVHNPNTRLFIGGIDKTKTKEQIMQAIGLHTGNAMIVFIIIYHYLTLMGGYINSNS